MMAPTCNPTIHEMEVGRSGVADHPWLHEEFKADLDYRRCYLGGREGDLFAYNVWDNSQPPCSATDHLLTLVKSCPQVVLSLFKEIIRLSLISLSQILRLWQSMVLEA